MIEKPGRKCAGVTLPANYCTDFAARGASPQFILSARRNLDIAWFRAEDRGSTSGFRRDAPDGRILRRSLLAAVAIRRNVASATAAGLRPTKRHNCRPFPRASPDGLRAKRFLHAS
jgi:hypothetical protein